MYAYICFFILFLGSHVGHGAKTSAHSVRCINPSRRGRLLLLESSKLPASAGRHEPSQKANPQYPFPLRDPCVQRSSLPIFEKGVIHATFEVDRIRAVWEALRAKRDMLVGLGAQQRAEMQHEPSVKMDF